MSSSFSFDFDDDEVDRDASKDETSKGRSRGENQGAIASLLPKMHSCLDLVGAVAVLSHFKPFRSCAVFTPFSVDGPPKL